MKGENVMDTIDAFLKKMIDEKEYSGLTADVQAQLIKDMRAELVDQIDKSIISEMTKQQAIDFAKLCDSPDVDQEKIEDFITKTGINRQAIAARTMVRFRDYYLGGSDKEQG